MGGLGVTNSGLTTLQQTAASTSPDGKASLNWWGRDVQGTYVNNQALFNAAVATLRTAGGRPVGDEMSYVPPQGWVYPPAWKTIATNLATIDVSVNSAEMTGTPEATVNLLAGLKIGVLAVEFLPWCGAAALQLSGCFLAQRPSADKRLHRCAAATLCSPPWIPTSRPTGRSAGSCSSTPTSSPAGAGRAPVRPPHARRCNASPDACRIRPAAQ